MVASIFSQTTVGAPSGVQALATQLVAAGQGSVLVYNTDAINSVFLGDTNSILATDQSNVVPLGPQGSIIFNGDIDVFACTTAGISVVVDLFPDASNFTPSIGVTPLVQDGTISGAPFGNVTAGSPLSILTLTPVSQYQSYDLNMFGFAVTPGVASSPIAYMVQLQWYDDLVSGVPVFEEDWWLYAGRNNIDQAATMAGCGPMHGRFLSVTIQIPAASASALTIQYINIFGSPRTVPYSDWRQNGLAVDPQIQNLTIVPNPALLLSATAFDNELANCIVTLSANELAFVPLGLYAGPVFYRFVPSVAAANDPVFVSLENVVSGALTGGVGNPGIIVNVPTGTAEVEGNTILPRAPVIFIIRAPAAGMSFDLQVIAQQSA